MTRFAAQFARQLLGLLACLVPLAASAQPAGHAMYVWSTGFDPGVAGCDSAKLVAWDKASDPECYTPTWDTPEHRQWLWDTANRPGEEVARLFVSGVKTPLQNGYLANDCAHPDVLQVKQMLTEGHCQVPGVALHALFSSSDLAVSEQNHVPFVVWYNDVCAVDDGERFDGIAVNNEAWNQIRCSDDPTAERAYLDDLRAVTEQAALQQHGTLQTHYSIGWHWGQCSGVDYELEWDGTTQPPTHHMIDLFDSVDVQAAHVSASTVADRALTAGYAHAVGLGKPFYVTSYTNERSASECTTTHFPYYCSYTWSNTRRSDAYLVQQIFDQFASQGIPSALGSIHYFRGVYSSGGHTDWPSYASGSVGEACVSPPPAISAVPDPRFWLVSVAALLSAAAVLLRRAALA